MRTKEPRPFGWWARTFEREAWDDKVSISFYDNERLLYNPYCGFCGWRIISMNNIPALEITKGCGDIRYWRDEIYAIFKHIRLPLILFHTYKNPDAYMRVLRLPGKVIHKMETKGINCKVKHWLLYAETGYAPSKDEVRAMWGRTEKLPPAFGTYWKRYEEAMNGRQQLFLRNEQMFFDDNGFLCWSLNEKRRAIILTRCCGDGRYWRNIADKMLDMAKDTGVADCIMSCSRREPKAYARLFGCEVYKAETTNDGIVYWYIKR